MKRKLQNLLLHFRWYERRIALRRLQEVTMPFALMREAHQYHVAHCVMLEAK